MREALAIFARFPTPPCAETLGWRLIAANPHEGTVAVAFEATRAFCNPAGFVQGGFLAAMLDDCMGPAVLVKSRGALFAPTIQLSVAFLAPARPGQLKGEGKVVRLGTTVTFLEGRLFDSDDNLVATATASARLLSTAGLPR